MSADSGHALGGTAPLHDRALTELCCLLERNDTQLAPDAVWLSGNARLYDYLRELGALTLASTPAASVLCHECCSESFSPTASLDAQAPQFPYRGYCRDCGWVPLTAEQARPWQVLPAKIAQWLAKALHLTQHYPTDTIIDGTLWRLGECEHQRRRRTLFFGCRLDPHAQAVRVKLDALCAPGAEVLITTSNVAALRETVLADRRLVPLRAITHLRKAGFVVENLASYLAGPGPIGVSDETSLRLMHTSRVALINGDKHPLSPQVYAFLKVLEDADGDEVHKRRLAHALGIRENFRPADVFKRRRLIFDTFIETDHQGNFWLKPEFVIVHRH